ncbi:prepilin-type N-terminal cleavage/methylation domain-containing protein [Candidatus Aerophobetes bacterium]|nr:prepilin-type N-terminal cleavage/methylation domain-containing protein [Candidatus Aerophobetes bacterium]
MGNKGFTIIEVLFAIFITAVAITGIVMGFSNGLFLVGELRQISDADRLCQQKMEELRGDSTQLPGPPDFSETTFQDIYDVTISATPAIAPGLTKVTVTVSFTSRSGRNIERKLVTYFTENGISKGS